MSDAGRLWEVHATHGSPGVRVAINVVAMSAAQAMEAIAHEHPNIDVQSITLKGKVDIIYAVTGLPSIAILRAALDALPEKTVVPDDIGQQLQDVINAARAVTNPT